MENWMVIVLVVIVTTGISTTVWVAAGLARVIAARGREPRPALYRPEDVAILIAAHNEELVITNTIESAAAQVPLENIFVVSDGSSDTTVAIAAAMGATVLETTPNKGKAGAIREALDELGIPQRFSVLLLLDADTRLRPDYLSTGLPLFDSPDIVAVAGRATSATRDVSSLIGRFLTAYRERIYVCTQFLQKYGQAARYANAVAIVPGFASMYRTDILDRVDIDAPGLSIEDFNMTFEVHAKELGRIAFHPGRAIAETQDPVSFGEYTRQVRRWCMGFWQTVRRHGAHVGVFWAALGLFIVETVVTSVALVLVLPVIALGAIAFALSGIGGPVGETAADWAAAIPTLPLLLGFIIADLVLTVTAAILSRRWPTAGVVLFPFMRVVDAAVCLLALAAAFGRPSDGRWRSPERRPVTLSSETGGVPAELAISERA